MLQTMILGVDGLPSWMWRQFAESDVMPFSAELLRQGSLVSMQSSAPEVSSAAWASIVTGQNPGGHNVYGFTDLMDGGYMMGFTSSRTFKAKPFWTESDRNHLIVNVPQTYPALPMSGALVSGFVALDLDRAVYPTSRLPALQSQDYRVDADMSIVESSKARFLDDLRRVMRTRMQSWEQLWNEGGWDRAMFVLTGVDRLNHYFWEDYEDADSPFHQAFLDYYREVDRAIQSVVERLDDRTHLIVVSDHGFARQRVSLNVNCVLRDYGYLELKQSERPSYRDIRPGSRAFAMDPGRVYIHRQGRYPNAELADEQAEEVAAELTRLFLDLEIDGRPVVERVLRGAEVYSGPYAHRAPDLVLMPADEVALSGRIQADELLETTSINGKHTFEHATFYHRGPTPLRIPRPMRVEDVLGVVRQAEQHRKAA